MPIFAGALRSAVVSLASPFRPLAKVPFIRIVALLFAAVSACAQNAAPPGPNSDPTYQALRNIALGSESVSVSNLELRRDAGTFHLRSGNICFVAPVNGKVTGAVFVGNGNFVLSPPVSELGMLKLLTKEDEFSESFSHLVLRFTDSTYDEIKAAGTTSPGGCDSGLLRESQNAMRHGHTFKYNLDARILQDVLSPEPGTLFVAFVHGKHYNDKELFVIDPHGASYAMGEEVALMTYDESKFGVWAAFRMSGREKNRGGHIHIEHQVLDTTIEKNAYLTGKATTAFVVQVNGSRVIPLDLFPTLRVQSVSSDGQALYFIQENKDEDANFSVILPKPLNAGDKFTITTTYGGKEAVVDEGGGNYYPVAREDWYPSTSIGDRATYEMTFRIPKGMKIAATGELISESNDGGQNVTLWKSEAPQTFAGFNFGRFKEEEVKLTKPEYLVQSFANQDPPNWVEDLKRASEGALPTNGSHLESGLALGTMSTTLLIKKALAEGQIATQIYTDYFGPSSFKRLAITQQTDCRYGQSWPELVWIPMCYFFDTTVRHQLGMDFGDRGYWKVVTPHEVAHQWWGHTVGFSSYRDQWMSEGFADMSASIYLYNIEQSQAKFISFWNDERELLLERNADGFRAIDAGAVTMGYRMSNSRTGFDLTRRLIYPKGAYILHMVRMMMRDNRTGEERFKETMHDFVSSYAGRSATTEDFKTTVEKHMTREMDLEGNQKLDWFFNEYVYGTQLPAYKLDYSFDNAADGDVVFNFRLTQSRVNDNFRMLVPIYLELADGKMLFLGRARLSGNASVEQKVPLKGLKEKPRRALVNYYDDVLASPS
jgi:Peptidase family M1 domain